MCTPARGADDGGVSRGGCRALFTPSVRFFRKPETGLKKDSEKVQIQGRFPPLGYLWRCAGVLGAPFGQSQQVPLGLRPRLGC